MGLKSRLQQMYSRRERQAEAVAAQALADRPSRPARFVLLQAFILQYFRRLPKAKNEIKHASTLSTEDGSGSGSGIGRGREKRMAVTMMRAQGNVMKQRLTVEVALGLQMLVRLGFYATVPTFLELSQHVTVMLDGRTDPLQAPRADDQPMHSHSHSHSQSQSHYGHSHGDLDLGSVVVGVGSGSSQGHRKRFSLVGNGDTGSVSVSSVAVPVPGESGVGRAASSSVPGGRSEDDFSSDEDFDFDNSSGEDAFEFDDDEDDEERSEDQDGEGEGEVEGDHDNHHGNEMDTGTGENHNDDETRGLKRTRSLGDLQLGRTKRLSLFRRRRTRRWRCSCCPKKVVGTVINSTAYTLLLILCVPLSLVTAVLRLVDDSVVASSLAEEWGLFFVDIFFVAVFFTDVVLRIYVMTWKRYTRDVLCVIDIFVSVLDAVGVLLALVTLANFADLSREQTLAGAATVLELSPVLRLSRFSRAVRLLRVARVARAVTLATRSALQIEDAFVPAKPSRQLHFRYQLRHATRSVLDLKIVAVDLLRLFCRINDDIRLNRLVASCQTLFASLASRAVEDHKVAVANLKSMSIALDSRSSRSSSRSSSSNQRGGGSIHDEVYEAARQDVEQLSKRPTMTEYLVEFQRGIASLFEHDSTVDSVAQAREEEEEEVARATRGANSNSNSHSPRKTKHQPRSPHSPVLPSHNVWAAKRRNRNMRAGTVRAHADADATSSPTPTRSRSRPTAAASKSTSTSTSASSLTTTKTQRVAIKLFAPAKAKVHPAAIMDSALASTPKASRMRKGSTAEANVDNNANFNPNFNANAIVRSGTTREYKQVQQAVAEDYSVEPFLTDSDSDYEDDDNDEEIHVAPSYAGVPPSEQTLQWLLSQKQHLFYYHGSRIWANHEDLHHVPGSIVSGGVLEHEVDSILLDLLLYEDFELALKSLSLLIQKYRRWETLQDIVR